MSSPPTPSKPSDEDEMCLLNALQEIARGECWGREDDGTCNCPTCIAEQAIKRADGWRFEAALADRVVNGFHPAEARMIEAWRCYMKDQSDVRLAQVLRLDGPYDVTRRDWYVATSVVQWLATNIGSTIIEKAGYKYTKYDEDHRCRAEKLPPTLGDVTGDPMVKIREIAVHVLQDASEDRLYEAIEEIAVLAGGIHEKD